MPIEQKVAVSELTGQALMDRYDPYAVRKDFPILSRTVRNGKPLVYLDNAARSQMPVQVIETVRKFDLSHNANVHRGIHMLSDEATDAYELARSKVADHLGVKDPNEIVFTRNATEGLNLIAYSLALHDLSEGDEIVLSVMEHHSNLVPWQALAELKGLVLKHIPITPAGELDMEAAEKLIGERTRVVSLVHLSNVLGTINDIPVLARMAKNTGALFVCDGSQSAAHLPVNMTDLGADFFVMSGYKMLGPTGIGVLWGKLEHLEKMHPFLYGGSMISEVGLMESSWAPVPQKFEAGTPNISGAIGLGAACDYVRDLGREEISRYEEGLIEQCVERLSEIGGVSVYGSPPRRASVIAFNIDEVHPHDTASILDSEGVAIRAGHHCAQPLHVALGIESSARASFHCYNTEEDLDSFISAIKSAKEIFGL